MNTIWDQMATFEAQKAGNDNLAGAAVRGGFPPRGGGLITS
jgi:hypothetical protein